MGIRSKRKGRTRTTDQPTTPPPSRRRNDAHPPSPAADWAALPHDLLCEILSRVPQADILRGAGLTCASWRRAAVHEPLLWRRIDLAADEIPDAPAGWKAMARAAVDRSAGHCESFRGPADADFLLYLAHSAPSLRSLHVTSRIYAAGFTTEAMEKLAVLEELVLVMSRGWFDEESLRCALALFDQCRRLRRLEAGGCYTLHVIGKELVARWRLPSSAGEAG